MYCPNPECPFFLETGTPAEYRQEFLQCSDCGTALQSAKPALRRRAEPMEDPVHGPVYFDRDEPDRDRLVTVATYSLPERAHYAQGILESVGVTAFVGDDHLAGIAPPLGAVAGGVKLNVPADQVDQAIATLEEYRLIETGEGTEEISGRTEPDDETDDGADAFFVNAVFALIRWAGYAVVVAIVVMIVMAVFGD